MCSSDLVDSSGRAHVTGSTYARNFPTSTGAAQRFAGACSDTYFGCTDAFVTRVAATGAGVTQSTRVSMTSTTAVVGRFITDWAGPEAMLEKISIRLGAPACPDDTMRFTGTITRTERRADLGVVEVALQGVNKFGAHVTGTAVLTLPAD